ncbi:zinc finger protein 91 [Drosophila tropicalis]|uniref:zinc finger protein 91 n=1 Tax=Drosophila tropicalis TaxID=46794 RepID=UPI0035AC0638
MSRSLVLTDEQSRLNARLEAHMVYICPECGKAFRTQVEWRQHLNTKHDYLKKTYVDFNFTQINNRFHECQICFKWVENAHKTIAMLQYHYFMHLDHSKTYRCVHCRMAYTRRRALNSHLLDTHMREIEKYEAKLRQMKRNEEQKALEAAATLPKPTKIPNKPVGRPPNKSGTARKRKDLLAKALMDIDLQAEDYKGTNTTSNSTEVSHSKASNASEQNLDRCLNAYEDILRKEEEQADLDALCEEFFVEKVDDEQELPQKPTEPKANSSQEVVIIEIDALGKEEVDQLQKELKPGGSRSPPSKRRRLSESEELNTQELTKLISYLCPKCGKEISSMDAWRTHVFEKHDFEHFIENNFKIIEPGYKSMCLQCREIQTTTKRSELQKHCFKHLPYRSYLKCSLCDRTKTSMSKMYNHIRYNHQEELQSKNKTQLIVKPEPRWNISPKHRLQTSAESLRPESPPNDGDEHLVCEYCNKIFKTYWRHKRHEATCIKAGVLQPESLFDTGADLIMKHLREGCLRMSTIC